MCRGNAGRLSSSIMATRSILRSSDFAATARCTTNPCWRSCSRTTRKTPPSPRPNKSARTRRSSSTPWRTPPRHVLQREKRSNAMMPLPESENILILDFGAQYAQLIARRVREQNVFCQLVRHDLPATRIAEMKPRGLILSGGPSSVYEPGAPHCDPAIFKLGVPVLGICYGMQEACHVMGGQVQ